MVGHINIFKNFNIIKIYNYISKIRQSKRFNRYTYFYRNSKPSKNNTINHLKISSIKLMLVLQPKKFKYNDDEITFLEETKDTSNIFKRIFEAILIFSRAIIITCIAIGLLIAYLITRCTSSQKFPIILLKSIEFLGPTFTKFGQWISTRRDMFPMEICDTLSRLQRNAPTHSWGYTKHLLRTTYGNNWRRLFVKFENVYPIGTGCCAQVYKAWINPDARIEIMQQTRISRFIEMLERLKLGYIIEYFEDDFENSDYKISDEKFLQPVAVKVLHPGIKSQLRRDLTIMRLFCQCAMFVSPELNWLNLTDCIDEFSRIISAQVDMKLEAFNLLKFKRNFSKTNSVIFPTPYNEFTRREILVESFHEGTCINDYLNHTNLQVRRALAKIGVESVLKMIFIDNFMHCDMHPGNILVQEENKTTLGYFDWLKKIIDPDYEKNKIRLVILDCGLVVSLNERCRENLRDVFRSVLLGDGELVAEYILRHSSRKSHDPEGFKTALGDILKLYMQKHVNLNNVNVSTVVAELFSAMVRHRVKQDGSFSSVMLGVAVIESLGRSLYPNIDIVSEFLPFVFDDIPCRS